MPIKGEPLVGISVATYNQVLQLPVLIASLKAQTYPHFRVAIVHDGPPDLPASSSALVAIGGDHRFSWHETAERRNLFGHNCRVVGEALLPNDCTYLMSTNGDNFYMPTFLEAMVHGIAKANASLVHCNCIHSHKLWQPMDTRIERGHIDIGGWLSRADLVRRTPWTRDMLETFFGDWTFLEAMAKTKGFKAAKVKNYLFVHN